MVQEALKTNPLAARAAWRIYFALASVQTALSLALLFRTQSENSAGLLLGFSPIRLVIALFLLAVLMLFVWLLLETWFRPQDFYNHWKRLITALDRRRIWNSAVILCSALFLLGILTITQMADVTEPFARTFFDRLLPVLVWVTGLSGQSVIALLILRHGRGVLTLRPQGRLFYFLLLAFVIIFLGWSWVAGTVVPAETQRVGWNVLGVPIVEWQVLVAWLAGVLMLVALAYLASPSPEPSWLKRLILRRLDLVLVLLIWLAAVIVWQSVPLSPSWFLSEPAPTNHEYYPSSDALAYDAIAQSALVGEGYRYYGLLYTRRPLLAMFLTLLHLLGGQSYERVVFLQILFLAWIPVLIYLITKALHNRVSGVIAASLIIIREANSIWLTERITTSHAKLLMADLPTMLVTLIFVLVGITWLKNITERKLLALITGGALGFAMLVRPEVFVYALPMLLISGLILWKGRGWRLWLQGSLLFALGVLLVISPWIWRNYAVTGEFFFDNPLHNTSLILQRFHPKSELPESSPKNSEDIVPVTPASPPKETSPAIQASASPPQKPATPVPTPEAPNERLFNEMTRTFGLVLQNPGAVVQVSLAHYFNSQVQSLLMLPSAFRLPESLITWIGHRSAGQLWEDCCGLVGYTRRLPYWRQWDGRFPASSLVTPVLNLLLIAYGVNEAWKRNRWSGITPLVLAVTYLLANALFRNSGGRYILPVDWVVLAYFSIGLAQFTMAGMAYLQDAPVVEKLSSDLRPSTVQTGPLLRSPQFFLAVIGLFLIGCAAPALEVSFPQRYDEARRVAMVTALLRSEQLSTGQRDDLYKVLAKGGIAYTGRALYPRYFAPNVGNPGVGKKDPFAPKPYPRLGFYLAGSYNSTLSLPIKDEPSTFPDGQDVVVIGCNPRDLLVVARFFADGDIDELYLRSFLPPRLVCPLPAIPEIEN
ncbi:MAG: hypothetical protein A2W35_07680 [Chloroflexi bacterium RBG_16_57_11]|nr:MAG: hypothetical protein A2W35_07680 [Chloroflexi bacterium RBG_16_57_11]